jgi:beta-lactamase class A
MYNNTMAFFGKNYAGEEYRERQEELLENKLPSRHFKDLIPENKKKRREPVKPWGKKERYLVLIVLAGTVLTSAILALSARDWKLPGLPRLTPSSFDFLGSETIVIEKGGRQDKDALALLGFNKALKDLSGTYGLYVIRLSGGSSYGVAATEIFQAASLIKLPVLGTLYQEAERGKFNLEGKYTLRDSDKIAGSGSLAGKPAGTVLTFRELAKLMGNQSDNTAYGIVVRTLGGDKVNAFMKAVGMNDTSIENNETTPHDIGIFFHKLYQGEIVSAKSRDEILGYLTKTIYENWLVAGIPSDVRVAHKYGRELHVVNDAGIVFTPKPFILVIMSRGIIESEADSVFPDLAKIIYDVESEN